MIDAKLNEMVPGNRRHQSPVRKQKAGNRTGLSIKDTVAGSANLSTGGERSRYFRTSPRVRGSVLE